MLLLDVLNKYVAGVLEGATRWLPEKTALMHWSRFLHEYDVVTVADLTLDMQDEYIRWRYEELAEKGHGGSGSTLARELGVMQSAINDGWKRGRLANPVYVRSVPQAPPRPHFLFLDEVRSLLACCEEEHVWRFCMIALHTVQRPGAVLGLHRDSVRLREGIIDFLPPGQTQTRKRKPVVPISPTLERVLQDAIADSESGHVIEFRGRPIASVRTGIRRAAERAGLERVSPNTLRHTGATLLLAAGVPIREVSGMLGHSEQKTTELYGKHHPSFLAHARAGVEELFGQRVGISGDSSLMTPPPTGSTPTRMLPVRNDLMRPEPQRNDRH